MGRVDRQGQKNARKRSGQSAPKGKSGPEKKKTDKSNGKPQEGRKRKAKAKALPKEKQLESPAKAKPSRKGKKAAGLEEAKASPKEDQAEGHEFPNKEQSEGPELPNGKEAEGPVRKESKKNPQLVSKEEQAAYQEFLGCELQTPSAERFSHQGDQVLFHHRNIYKDMDIDIGR